MKSTSSQRRRILDSNSNLIAPIDYQDILKMEGTRGLPLEPYLWRYHSSANPSPKQRRCRALSSWLALPVLQMALLLPKSREQLASPMAADIIMNSFVLEQMCLVSVTNVLLSDSRAPAGCRRARRVQAGRPGAGRKMQLHTVCTQT